ncbi:MAG: helix-turn-helix domain-containing protein [Fimbriimonas sp.]
MLPVRMPNVHYFATLAGHWPQSVADRLPVVVRIDNEGVDVRDVDNTHGDFHALYVVRNGRGIHVIDGIPHGVARGDVYVMAMGATHRYSQNEDLSLDAVYFRPEALEGYWEVLERLPSFPGDRSLRSGKWLHLTPAGFHAIHAQFEELRREWLSGTDEGALLARGLFARIFVHLCRAAVADPSGPMGDRRAEREWTISEAVRFLDERYADEVRIEPLARRLCLSPDRFTELFRAAMGRTPRDYLRHVRVERAKALLTTTDLTAAEVGVRVGFADAAHFSRSFRAATGQPPSAFRRNGP